MPPRNPEETRYRLQEAAEREFARYGFAGARVARIARKARTNQRMVYHYFGGKQGLYDALREQWLAQQAVIAAPELPIDQVIAGYFASAAANPAAARLLLWQALGDSPDDALADSARSGAQQDDIREIVADLRRRQEAGELTKAYDAEFILLVCWSAIMAPLTLPHVVRGAYGAEPWSDEFRDRFLPQLQRLFAADRRS